MTSTSTATPLGARSVGAPIVGCVLARDEERTIERAVRSLRQAVDIVYVIDSGSTDATVDRATAAGARVVVHPFESFSRQRNWALEHIKAELGEVWVLSIDADEWLSDELAAEVRALASNVGEGADFYVVSRRVRFDGRILRHGGFGRTRLTRLLPATARYEDRDVNEHVHVPPGARLVELTGWLEHDDVDDWTDYIAKHNRYSTLEAEARLAVADRPPITVGALVANPTLIKRFLRERVWNHLPAGLRPAIRFAQVYVVSAGFLDGRSGFRRALFEAWQEMTTDLKAEALAQADGRRIGPPSRTTAAPATEGAAR